MAQNEIIKWKPPTVTELMEIIDSEDGNTSLQTMAGMDIFNIALNEIPPARWIKKHPIINVKIGEKTDAKGNVIMTQYGQPEPIMAQLEYIPIEKHRLLGKRFFGWVGEEILREGVMFQSVYVTVRLHYTHPITGQKLFHDGIGACDAQTKKGASAADLANINPGAIQKGLPSAASYAFNNAYKKFGRIFGQDLQKDAQQFNEAVIMYAKSFYDAPNIEDLTELYEMKKEALSPDEIVFADRIINNKESNSYSKLYKILQSK